MLGGKLRMFAGGELTDADKSSSGPTDPGHTSFPAFSGLKSGYDTTLDENSDSFY